MDSPAISTRNGFASITNHISEDRNVMSTVYNNGTHYAMSDSSEVLKEISDSENVLEVTEEYIGSTASEHAEVWIRGLSLDECV